jgi:histidine triad (HIT) family protein
MSTLYPPSSTPCLFCKIASGAIPVTRLYEDEQVLAFPDINPQAPSLAHTAAEDSPLLGHLLRSAAEIARQQNLAKGYRLVINTGPDGGQTVEHLHIHLLGGRHMGWPPG